MCGNGANGSLMPRRASGLMHLKINQDAAESRVFPPQVRLNVVKMACERPDTRGRSLAQWDCTEIARELVRMGLVENISVETVRQMLLSERLRPWRHQMWLSAKVPRDAMFAMAVMEIADLYAQELPPDEMVLSIDEKTSLQPRPRLADTRPTRPDSVTQVEHEYKRAGALNLFAALDTRSGYVWATTAPRKRQDEFIELLEELDRSIGPEIRKIHIVLDNVSVHKGKKAKAWVGKHSRFVFHHPPTHCSWMNQVEQWFSILQRKRLTIVDFESKSALSRCLLEFVQQWNEYARPFNWSYRSFEKILSKCDLMFSPELIPRLE